MSYLVMASSIYGAIFGATFLGLSYICSQTGGLTRSDVGSNVLISSIWPVTVPFMAGAVIVMLPFISIGKELGGAVLEGYTGYKTEQKRKTAPKRKTAQN